MHFDNSIPPIPPPRTRHSHRENSSPVRVASQKSSTISEDERSRGSSGRGTRNRGPAESRDSVPGPAGRGPDRQVREHRKAQGKRRARREESSGERRPRAASPVRGCGRNAASRAGAAPS